jgi:hypothetical protein
MQRPELTKNPAVPSQKSPVPGYEGETCGDSWHFDVEVRKPYSYTDEFSVILAGLAGAELASPVEFGGDPVFYRGPLEAAYKLLDSDTFENSHRAAQFGLDGWVAEGYVGETNRKAIQKMLDRAIKYFNQAAELKQYWFGYMSDPNIPFMGVGMGWPLWERIEDRWDGTCEFRRAPKKGTVSYTVEGAGDVSDSYTCPSQEKVDEHNADAITMQKIALAAVKNLRCAQEALYVVGFYEKNKEIRTGIKKGAPTRGTSRLGILPSGGLKKATLIPLDLEPDVEPGAPVIPEPDPEPPTTTDPGVEAPAPKKKDNTLLIVGAAAVALLVLGKK